MNKIITISHSQACYIPTFEMHNKFTLYINIRLAQHFWRTVLEPLLHIKSLLLFFFLSDGEMSTNIHPIKCLLNTNNSCKLTPSKSCYILKCLHIQSLPANSLMYQPFICTHKSSISHFMENSSECPRLNLECWLCVRRWVCLFCCLVDLLLSGTCMDLNCLTYFFCACSK